MAAGALASSESRGGAAAAARGVEVEGRGSAVEGRGTAVGGCGGLWRAVEGCGSRWKAVEGRGTAVAGRRAAGRAAALLGTAAVAGLGTRTEAAPTASVSGGAPNGAAAGGARSATGAPARLPRLGAMAVRAAAAAAAVATLGTPLLRMISLSRGRAESGQARRYGGGSGWPSSCEGAGGGAASAVTSASGGGEGDSLAHSRIGRRRPRAESGVAIDEDEGGRRRLLVGGARSRLCCTLRRLRWARLRAWMATAALRRCSLSIRACRPRVAACSFFAARRRLLALIARTEAPLAGLRVSRAASCGGSSSPSEASPSSYEHASSSRHI